MTSIVNQVVGLKTKSIQELKSLWRDLFHQEPPPYTKAWFIPRLAYRLQELALGGLNDKAQKKLDNLVSQMEKNRDCHLSLASKGQLLKGTTLIREWQGQEYKVTVIEGGFEYQGQRYKSLSAIARKITGTQWSGPAFFGVRSP